MNNVFAISITRSKCRWLFGGAKVDTSDIPKFENEEKFDGGHFDIGPTENIRSVLERASLIAEELNKSKPLHCFSISCFGPFHTLDIANLESENYGKFSPRQLELSVHKLTTSLPNLLREVSPIKGHIFVMTDANAIALGEAYHRYSSGQYPISGISPEVQYRNTVVASVILGRGIGGGIAVGSTALQARFHAEMGHLVVAPLQGDEKRAKRGCPVHRDCFTDVLGKDRFVLDSSGKLTEADLKLFGPYASQLCANLVYSFAPELIVLSGSTIRENGGAIDVIRSHLSKFFKQRNGKEALYIEQENPELVERFIDIAHEGSGVLGALIFGAKQMSEMQKGK
jgi:hypothetical protein